MSMTIKLIVTGAMVLLAIAVLLIDSGADTAGPHWMWRLGKYDPIRNLICRRDGSLRRYTKLAIVLGFAAGLAVLWALVPTR